MTEHINSYAPVQMATFDGEELNPEHQMPEEDFKAPTAYELEQETQKNITEFKDLLDTIKSADNKLKSLWRQIYDNAVTDRRNSYIAFADLYMQVHSKKDEHATHGLTLSKYLERMEKSNTQLLKLAELIQKYKDVDEEDELTANDIYSRLENRSQSHKQSPKN